MPVPRHGSAADKRGAEIAHLRRDKGYSASRAAAAAYSMYGEEEEYEDLMGVGEDDDGPSAASPRFDEKTVRKLLELCREARKR
jgi:hypothetical protein